VSAHGFSERITFPVSAQLELRGILVEIAKGQMQRICSGEIRIKGTFKVGALTLVEKEWAPVPLPGTIRFDSKEPLARAAGAEA
jgi:hypothetical protein